jgi:glucosyl-3-phosphoglycerate synthase
MRMSIEIGQTLLRALSAEGVVLGEGAMNALAARYVRLAQDTIRGYHADALINALAFDRHGEESMVDAFVEGLRLACRRHLDDALGVPMMPSWLRVAAAEPEFPGLLKKAVDDEAPVTAAA